MQIHIDQDFKMINITVEMVDIMIKNVQENIKPDSIEDAMYLCHQVWDIIERYTPNIYFAYSASNIAENSLNPWFKECGIDVNLKQENGGLFESNQDRLEFLEWMRNKLQGK